MIFKTIILIGLLAFIGVCFFYLNAPRNEAMLIGRVEAITNGEVTLRLESGEKKTLKGLSEEGFHIGKEVKVSVMKRPITGTTTYKYFSVKAFKAAG